MRDFVRTAALGAGSFLSSFATAILARRAITPLLYANERMLRDIGLSHSDILDSLSGPLGADPSQLLIARINERREAVRDTPASVRLVERKAAKAKNDGPLQASAATQSRAA
jgi:uncharacterized protein YjiS (DUF1127 family)